MAQTKDILLQRIRNGGTLSTGAQVRLCLMLSYPAILAQLSSVLMQYIDASMVGHLGPEAGASIGLVSTCLWLLGGFCFALSSGFSVQVSHLIGANDFKSARSVLRQGLTVAIGFSSVLALVGAALSHQLPCWLGGGPDIVEDAGNYFLIMALFLPAMQIDWMCAAMLQASGNMKVPSLLSIGMCVLDVVFNYLFIYILDMGVVGAALGSGLAEVITGIAMLSLPLPPIPLPSRLRVSAICPEPVLPMPPRRLWASPWVPAARNWPPALLGLPPSWPWPLWAFWPF